MRTRIVAASAVLAAAFFLSGCVEGYYGEVGLGGPVVYGDRYPDPYYGGYYPRYDRYDRYDRSYYRRYDRRYDRRYERPRRPDYAARPDYPRPSRPDYAGPRPNPVVVQPQPQPEPPRVQSRTLPRGRLNCGGAVDAAGLCDPRGRGGGWGKMN